jgi:hypothetical protein
MLGSTAGLSGVSRCCLAPAALSSDQSFGELRLHWDQGLTKEGLLCFSPESEIVFRIADNSGVSGDKRKGLQSDKSIRAEAGHGIVGRRSPGAVVSNRSVC